ncbi:MAG: CPBP family intramembrane glutamic endopeptidase [Candidatus Limnocylindrales bacterium]
MTETIKFLIFIAIAGLLLLLRFDAARFGTAEFDDESSSGGLRAWLRRLAWYGLGAALVFAVYKIYPLPISVLHLDIGADRQRAVTLGLALGLGGTLVAILFAWYRYHRFRLPRARHYPGAIINSVATAFLDEALFRGIVLGLLLSYQWPLEVAIAAQAILYGLATRLGRSGRSVGMLLISVGLAIVAGYLTNETGGIGAAFVGHAITRFAIFLATGHAGQILPAGHEPEEEVGHSLPPDGWEIVVDPNAPTDIPVTTGRLGQVRPS